MKTRVVLSFSLAALVCGCASTGTQEASLDRTDRAYVDRVERAARGANVQIVWINPPQARVKAATQ
jgi:hypothetical protein